MKVKNKLFLFIIISLILVNAYAYLKPLFKDSNEPLNKEIAELTINSSDLISAFKNNEEKSDKLYSGKIIEVKGIIKEITFINDRTTIILNNNKENSFGIICDLNPIEFEKAKQLKNNQRILVKGICKGYLKDVILLNCSIEDLAND